MNQLNSLTDTSRPSKSRRRVGRGTGSGVGKTCGRGIKGQGARSGYKRRYGQEGGQTPLHKKLPKRGFSRVRFAKNMHSVNLWQIEAVFNDGETVSEESLRQRGLISGTCHGVKILSTGEITKKLNVQVNALSATARTKLEAASATIKLVGEK